MARRTRTITRLGRAEKGEMLRAINRRADVKNEAHTRVEQGGVIMTSDALKIMLKAQKTTGYRQPRNLARKSGRLLWRERGNLSKALGIRRSLLF